ncbi:MAG: type IV toxin-antitoxin system AbiEi family antitoxin domain-containing protein [Pseudolysinimonas sp.]
MDLDSSFLTFARDVRAFGDDPRAYTHAVERGRLVRPHRGVYADAQRWNELSEAERYVYGVLGASVSSRTNPIVSHISAAAIQGAPIIGPLPKLVHVLATPAAGTRTEHRFRKHATPHLMTDLETRGELRLTTLVRTLADVAVDSPFVTAVGVLDWAFRKHSIARADVIAKLDELGVRQGLRRARRAIEFADGDAASPGESLSRVRLFELGFPMPHLQQEFCDGAGLIGYVDFWWPDHRLIGEFDGVGKYLREEFAGTRTPAEVVIDEKRREDRLRALGHRVVRWGWSTAWKPYGLNPILLPTGLPTTRRSVR